MGMTVYCPYTNADVAPETTTREHIIPLSLGGHDLLQLPVDRDANSGLGSKIDGALANEFFVLRSRARQDVRGHRGRPPAVRIKAVKDSISGKPLQLDWGRRLKVYDPIQRRERPEAMSMEVSLKVDMDIRLRFLAKAFLSAGYFVYGEWFRSSVQHSDARLLMRGPRQLSADELASTGARVFHPFVTDLPPEQKEEFDVQEAMCSIVKGSLLVFLPGPRSLGIFGGILGVYLGMLSVPADTTAYPRTNEHDLGHAVIVSGGQVIRWSYRRLLARLHPEFEKMPKLQAGSHEGKSG